MKARGFLIWMFIFQLGQSFGQETLHFKLISSLDKRPVHGAVFTLFENSKIWVISKSDSAGGIRLLDLPKNIYQLEIDHPDFQKFQRDFEYKKLPNDTITLFLRPLRIQNLKEIKVKAAGIPDTLFSNNSRQVDDFELLEDGNVLILSHLKFHKNETEIGKFDFQNYTSLDVEGKIEEIYKDFKGDIYLRQKEKIQRIEAGKNILQTQEIKKDHFFQKISPYIGETSEQTYLSDYQFHYPEVNFYGCQKRDSTFFLVEKIIDELMMELYRSEYKWVDVRTKLWAKQKELDTGIDAEIWVGANFFTNSLYYEPVYAPFFIKDKSIYLFDYYKDRMNRYTLNGALVESIYIDHHQLPKETGWKRLLQDPISKNVYAVYEKNERTQLGKLNLESGEIEEKVELFFKGAKKVKIWNDFVYYVYRPFESTQTCYLYRERLPKLGSD